MIESLLSKDPGPGMAIDARPAGPVRITPNRRQIDRRFPVLGFTVDAGGLPFFEVLLTTDRTLFDPAHAGRRSPANFYASRQDSGLLLAEPLGAVYVAPTAVLYAFAGSPEIYYTVIAYRGRDGNGPAFAQAPRELPAAAPSVSVAADLRQASGVTASILSVPLDKLSRLRDDGTLSALAAPTQPLAADPADDEAEGEDGYGLAAEDEPYGASAADEEGGGWGPQSALAGSEDWEYDDGFEGSPEEAAEAAQAAAWGEDEEEDGPALEEGSAPLWAGAQESTFPSGAEAPAMLEDEDDAYGGDAYGEESSYDDGFGALSEEAAAGESYGEDEEMGDGEAAGFAFGEEEEPPPYETLEALQLQAPFPPGAPEPEAVPLTVPEKRRILSQITPFESGADGYAAINADGEFEGRFGPGHPAHQRYHVGLSYGIIQFTQDSGSLGRLLLMMRQRDAAELARIFGSQVDELLRVTNAPGPSSAQSPGGRSARVQPVGGADLWREPWLARFRQAAAHVPFQAAQNELAATLFLDPMLPFAGWLELNTDRALAMVVDRAIQMGVGGSRRWIIEAVGPVQTTAQRQQALAALGHADLMSFQRAAAGLDDDGSWGPLTHAAMVAALRQLGSRSPVPIATRDQMMDAMVRRAAGTPWERRTTSLRRSTAFTDVVYAL